MDLAKIRKKALQTRNEPVENAYPLPDLAKDAHETVKTFPVAPKETVCPSVSYPMAAASIVTSPSPITILADRVASAHTPLEAILIGRTAAGCDDESILDDDASSPVIAESSLEFLCFRVSDEIYGINIMDIKEIIKPREVTEVPHAPTFVSGVLSLRGTIIPIIDMRLRLGLPGEEPTGKERVIVIKNDNSFSGLHVDEVIQVVRVPLDAVEAAPAVLDGIDREFISGIGRSEGRLIIILNLENIADINLN